MTTITGATVKINLSEDEGILPPYLVRYEGGPTLNVTPATKPPRSASPKELLDYGDSFRLLPRLSFEAAGKENFLFVGGGVFEGRFFGPLIAKSDNPYGFELNRGWARVWVQEAGPGVRIETPAGTWSAQTAQFWVSVQNGDTEVYVLSGTVEGPKGYVATPERFLKWKDGAAAPMGGKPLTVGEINAKIGGVFPGLVKLAQKADDDWKDELTQKLYAEMRKNGWRKASRTAPDKKK